MGVLKERPYAAPDRKQQEAIRYLVLLLLAVLPYLNTLFNNFVYDDYYQVLNNPYVHSFHYLREILTTSVWSFQGAQGISNYYRPLMTLEYLLTYHIAGPIPFTFHLVNLVLEASAVWLVYSILRQLSGEPVGLIAAGLFALHPIHTEPVAWIAAVTDLQLAVFYLAAFFFYIQPAETGDKTSARVGLCVTFVLALLSKEQAMTLPALAMLYEHFYRDDRLQTKLNEKVARYASLWIIAGAYLLIRVAILGGLASVVMRPDLSWKDTFLSSVSLLGSYIGKLVWPVRLSAFYPFHPSHSYLDTGVLLGFAALTFSAILFGTLWKRAHIVSLAMVWIFLPLGPVLNARWMPAGVFAERYLYLPSIGICWLLGWAAVNLWIADSPFLTSGVRRAVPALLGLLALLCSLRIVSRNRDWRSDELLFRRVIEVQGEVSLIRSDLGAISYRRGDFPDAERDWLAALSDNPSNPFALDNMGLLRRAQHRNLEAAVYSERALRARPMFTAAHVNLAQTLAAMERTAQADCEFRTAIGISPLSTIAHNTYGNFLLTEDRKTEALAEFQRSAEADSNVEANDHLGDLYSEARDLARAEESFRRAIADNPFDTHAHFGLGAILEVTGRRAESLREYDSGLAMDPLDTAAKAAVVRLHGSATAQTDLHARNPFLRFMNGINW